MVNIVLMAGSGKRFFDAGYKISKPLIPVSGKPMILQAIKSMPKSEKWVFVVRQEHMKEEKMIKALKSVSKETIIIEETNPIGQLNSCLMAKEYYNNDENMFVGACDIGMVYNHKEYEQIMSLKNAPDMLVFSFTRHLNLSRTPHSFGWLKQDKNNFISGVSVKIPISNNPYNDYAIVGSFAFKSGKTFIKIADELIKRGITVKGEYYIDSMIEIAVEMGYKVLSFPIAKFIGWGIPEDYEDYLYWEKAIKNPKKYLEAKDKKEYLFWKEYFDNE